MLNSFFAAISRTINHRFFLWAIVLSCLYTMGRQSDGHFGWTNPKNTIPEHLYTIHTDGAGYYAYLPQWFVYTDSPHFGFLESISNKYKTTQFISGVAYDYKTKKGIDKYYIGTALCMSPFFLATHGSKAVFSERGGDGYSKMYQCSVAIAALSYWLLGVIGLILLLRSFKVSNFSIAFLITILSLGTSLNYYTVYFPSFSHVYSFCAITWFLFVAKKWAETSSRKYLFALGLLLGFIVVIRPTNALVILIVPFFFADLKHFFARVSTTVKIEWKMLAISILLFAIPVLFQLAVIHHQIGKWAFNTYSSEHFDYLLSPKFVDVLFSYKKGFFIYAPVMLLLLPALFIFFKKERFFGKGWLFVVFILLYITSSWWCWWYGGGLGMRPLIDFFSLLAIPIALFFDSIKLWMRSLLLIFGVVMIAFYQILQLQFNRNILHYDQMTKEGFWRVFLKSDKRYSWMLHLDQYEVPTKKIEKSDKFYYDSEKLNWKSTKSKSKEVFLSWEMPDPVMVYKPIQNWNSSAIALRFSGEMNICDPQSNPSIILQFFKNGEQINRKELYIGNSLDELNQFVPFSMDYYGDQKYGDVDSLVFTYTKGVPLTGIRNLKVEIFKIKGGNK